MKYFAGVMIGNLTVTLEENPMKVAVSYIENIGFAVGINNSFCDITFRIDDEYKTRTKGLMGKIIQTYFRLFLSVMNRLSVNWHLNAQDTIGNYSK